MGETPRSLWATSGLDKMACCLATNDILSSSRHKLDFRTWVIRICLCKLFLQYSWSVAVVFGHCNSFYLLYSFKNWFLCIRKVVWMCVVKPNVLFTMWYYFEQIYPSFDKLADFFNRNWQRKLCRASKAIRVE